MKSNKKRIVLVLAILTMAIALSFVFVACGNDTNKTGTEKTADYKVTIHPNNGQSDIVWDITKAIPTITKDGYHIAGCFLDAQLTTSTTLESLKTTELTKNIDVYVKWEEHVEATDTAVEPTCTEKGLTEGKHCSKCGKILTAQTEIDALGHDLENHAGQPATCTEKGWEEYVTCKRDGCTYTTYQEIAALDHDLEHHAGQTATCTEKGWEAYDTCKRDGCTYTTYKEIAALGHTGGTATCTEQATCERCNKKYGSALGHKYGDLISKIEPTCSATGTEAHYKCSACNKVFKDDENKTETTLDDLTIAINPDAHNFGEWIKNEGADTHTRVCSFNSKHTETENCHGGTATCTEQATCEKCNEKYGSALGHKYGDLIPKTEPTCSATGTEAHYKCSVCNKVFKDDELKAETTLDDLTIAINPDAHNFGKWIKNEGADTHTRVCSFNNEHAETENCHGGTATCTEQATCEKCNAKYGKALGHDYKGGVCTRCGDELASEGLEYSLNSDETGYTVTGIGTCTDTEIIIPSEYNAKPVTSIGNSAFNGCTGLTSVTIGNGVTSIGRYAFSGCTGLTSVTIGNSVTSIGNNPFYDCRGLTSIIVVEGNSKYHSAGNCLIESETMTLILGCKTSVIPTDGSVTSIGSEAFSGCKGLTSVTIGNSVTSIDDGAFRGCTGLSSITIPNSVTSIGDFAFQGCTGLTSMTIGNSVTSIGGRAFSGCEGLTSITIPDSVTSIGEQAFSGCTGLTSVTIGGNVTSVSNSAFRDCTSLTSVTIPDSVTSIGNYAFYGCTGLTSITIPDSVTSIGHMTFDNCTGLTSVTIGNSVTSIGGLAFRNCTGLTSVTIPDSVTSIGDSAFNGCTGLTSVTIGNSVTSIGDYAFEGCTGLTSITIPDSVTSIGNFAFSYCTGLTSILVADGNSKYHSSGNCLIETTSKTLISGCKTSVIPTDGSVTSIGASAFSGCTRLTSITIPDNVTSIGDRTFGGCTGLTSITIPDSVTRIGEFAFGDCTGLMSITFNGTIAQWSAISKGYGWKAGVPSACNVVCTDGEIPISEA